MKILRLLRPITFSLFSLFLSISLFADPASKGYDLVSISAEVLAPPQCNTPTWPTTSNITMNSATFSWDAVYGAASYSVQTRIPNGTWYTVPNSPFSGTWATVTWFLSGTTYEWRVRTNCTGGESSPWSYPVTFTTVGWDNCDPPAWLFTTNITTTSATLDWEPAAGAVHYTAQFRVAGGYWVDVPGGPWYNTWTTLYGLNPYTTYEWRVKSYCGNGMYSGWSYIASFTTVGSYCNAPTWPQTSYITSNSAKLTWEGDASAHSYTVQIRTLNGYWQDLGWDIYGTWVTAGSLNPCTTYEWRVRSNCYGGGYSVWTYPTSFTTTCTYSCVAPSWLYTSNITSSSATFGWDVIPGAFSYSIQYRLTGGSWNDLYGGPWQNNWVSVTNLQPGTAYEWRVKSNCSNWSYSQWSYSAGFTTLGYSCSTPSWLSTTNITESSASFSWANIWGAWSYSVQIRLANGTWEDVPGGPFQSNSAWVSGLTPGTNYQWRVRTNCEDGSYSYWSYATSFKTLGLQNCYTPQWLSTSSITETSANLNWDSVSGAQSYSIEWRVAGGTWNTLVGGPWSNTWATISGLTANTTYEWRVRTNCYLGAYSQWSISKTFTTIGSSCATPSGLITTNITDTTAQLSWKVTLGALSYGVQTRTPNGVWYDVIGSPFVDTTVVVDELIPGTVYEWRVRSKCGAGIFSNWSNPVTFTTVGSANGGIDDCDGATLLTVNNSCVNSATSNEGATQSSPEPMGWCPENNYKDVWFKFLMPDVADPVVTIRTTAGTLFDGIMEVYTGADCSSLEYLFCEDDNTTNNGSLMPVISITGSPNELIWVRVWGYAGTTGTFSICVFDYQSSNFASPDETFVSAEEETLFVADRQEPTVENQLVSSELHIAPNPTNDVFRITYAQTDISKVTGVVLMDMSGKLLYKKEYDPADIGAPEFREQVNVSSLSQGIYVVQVITTNGILTEKISVVD